MFKICQGTCFCAANSEGGSRDQETVLYCFGEVLWLTQITILLSLFFKGGAEKGQSAGRGDLDKESAPPNSGRVPSPAHTNSPHIHTVHANVS